MIKALQVQDDYLGEKKKLTNKESHLDISDLPGNVLMDGKGKWMNMDKIEYDKLEWMKDLPPPSADEAQVTFIFNFLRFFNMFS